MIGMCVFVCLQMFPDYDLVYDGKFNADMRTQKIQFDMTALSEILSVRISSYFGRTIREETVEQFRRFLTPPYSSTPTLLVIGWLFGCCSFCNE